MLQNALLGFVVASLAFGRAYGQHSIASSKVVGNMGQTAVSRDSCGSVRLRSDAALWVCRDSEPVKDGKGVLPLTLNTAAWSNISSDGTVSLEQYGPSQTVFYPLSADECPSSGVCSDGTRWVGWPDSPPLITESDSSTGNMGAYTWVTKVQLKGLAVAPGSENPPTSLYYVDYEPARDGQNLPVVTLIEEEFWSSEQPQYGTFGNVMQNSTAYLYAEGSAGVSIAKVPADSVKDTTKYEFYVNGAWTSTMPAKNDTGAAIANCGIAGGQGTFYYSSLWSEYVWIGGDKYPGATFQMTTAPAPEGPWATPYEILTEKGGTASLPAYSLQAHPGLTTGSGKDMYLSFTNCTDVYTTPLIYLTWA